jgi:hypothetical protein
LRTKVFEYGVGDAVVAEQEQADQRPQLHTSKKAHEIENDKTQRSKLD